VYTIVVSIVLRILCKRTVGLRNNSDQIIRSELFYILTQWTRALR